MTVKELALWLLTNEDSFNSVQVFADDESMMILLQEDKENDCEGTC